MINLINEQLAYSFLKTMGGSAEGYEVRELAGIQEDPNCNYTGKNTHGAMLRLEEKGIVYRTKRNSRQVTWHIARKNRLFK